MYTLEGERTSNTCGHRSIIITAVIDILDTSTVVVLVTKGKSKVKAGAVMSVMMHLTWIKHHNSQTSPMSVNTEVAEK